MILSFICWLIGMETLKDYGWEFKEALMVWCGISAFVEWLAYFVMLFFYLGVLP